MCGMGCPFVKAETRCMMCIESLHSIFVTECSYSGHMLVNILFGISHCAPTQVSFEVVTVVQFSISALWEAALRRGVRET